MSKRLITDKYKIVKALNEHFGKEVFKQLDIHGSQVSIEFAEDLSIEETVVKEEKTEEKSESIVEPSPETDGGEGIQTKQETVETEEDAFDLEKALSIKVKKDLDVYSTKHGYPLNGKLSLANMRKELKEKVNV